MPLHRTIRRGLALMEILGGAAAAMLVLSIASERTSVPPLLLFLLFSVAATSGTAGVLLWQDQLKGYELSKLLQLLQAIRFSTPTFTFVVASGPEFLVGWNDISGLWAYIGFAGSFVFGSPDSKRVFWAINTFAVLAYVLIQRGHLAKLANERR